MPHPPRFIRTRAGLTYRLHPDGTRTLLVPSGGSGDDDDGDETGADQGATSGGSGKVLTQQQIDSMIGRERRKAEAEARKAIEESLGMKVDDLASFVKRTQEADELRMSEAELATKRAQEREQAAEAKLANANALLTRTRVTATMLGMGVDVKAAERLASTVDVSPDADDDEIAAAVEALRTDLPALFGAQAGTTPPSTPGRGQRPIPKAQSNLDDADAFAEKWVTSHGRSDTLPTL